MQRIGKMLLICLPWANSKMVVEMVKIKGKPIVVWFVVFKVQNTQKWACSMGLSVKI